MKRLLKVVQRSVNCSIPMPQASGGREQHEIHRALGMSSQILKAQFQRTYYWDLYITDMVKIEQSPLGVQNAIKNTANQDGASIRIGIEQYPSQTGISEADYLVRMQQGYSVKKSKTRGIK